MIDLISRRLSVLHRGKIRTNRWYKCPMAIVFRPGRAVFNPTF